MSVETNADAIRRMDDETLANFLIGIQKEFIKPDEIREWIKHLIKTEEEKDE